jgi:starch synthase
MRLLTVTHFYEAHGGGIERVAGRLNREFAALGHETLWAASDEDALPAPDTATPVPLACWNLIERITGLPMPIPGLSGLRRLRKAIRASDAVVVHDALYASSIAAMLLARRAGKPVLLVQHIADIPFSSVLLQRVMTLANRLVTRPMLRAADRLVFISDTTRRAFAEVKTRAPALLLFNGVDTDVFRPGPGDARAELEIGAEAKLVLFVGRFVEKKGLAVLERVARARPDWRFVLAGRGPIDPRRWGLANVTVAEGRSGASLAALYRAADLLLLPSVGEGYPLVVQEAMACGLPVVCGGETARADPGAAAWLRGVAIALADPDGTARRVVAAVEAVDVDADGRAAMSAYAARTYDWRAMAAQIVAAIRAA